MSAMGASEPREWMGGGGVVAERTNAVINTLVESMNEQGAYTVTMSALDDVIRKVADVGGEDTLEAYRRRVGRYGPFDVGVGSYTLKEEYRRDR